MLSAAASKLKEVIGIETEPIAVFLLAAGSANPAFDGFTKVTGHRYCQLLMRARHGESLRLMPDEIACPAAASAFGFKPLAAEPPAQARHARPGVLPQLEGDLVLTLEPEDVMAVFRIVLDNDRDEALHQKDPRTTAIARWPSRWNVSSGRN